MTLFDPKPKFRSRTLPKLTLLLLIYFCTLLVLVDCAPPPLSPIKLPHVAIYPSKITANSQAYLNFTSLPTSSYLFSIHASNHSSCRFKTQKIPCECLFQISDSYVLEENEKEIFKFVVLPPNLKLIVPNSHELLHPLEFSLLPNFCLRDAFRIALEYRPFQIFPGSELPEGGWTQVTVIASSLQLHQKKERLTIGCQHFADPGFYRITAHSKLLNFTVISSILSINSTNSTYLKLREDSIFPHCTSEYTVGWAMANCPAASLNYRLRVLALPEGNVNHEDRAVYIEETGLEYESNPLSISCSQFDIIYEKYCFELVSVNLNTTVFHLWQSTCVSTEPVHRQNGKFGSWSEWQECSKSCGIGEQRRIRYCDNPPPNSRGKDCIGEVMEIRKCVMRECPEAQSHHQHHVSSNCSCGCLLEGNSGTFFASAHHSPFCPQGNQTWSLVLRDRPMVVDFNVKKDEGAAGRMFFFVGAPYEELIWYAEPSRDPAFTVALDRPVYIVLWSKNATADDMKMEKGYTITYHLRDPPTQMPIRFENSCNPICSETLIISALGVVFLLVIFVPPIVCANITERMRRGNSPDVPLIDQKHENEMIRSGNTECTQLSGAAGNGRDGGRDRKLQTGYVAKRSIGIQLSVQNTPKLTRACGSADSPLPRGQSSLSASDELEYDYYDGTTIPGSLLAPPTQILSAYGDMMTEIDIDQIIGQSEIFSSSNQTPVQKADVQTQAGEFSNLPNCTKL